jgi:hypothetical protein
MPSNVRGSYTSNVRGMPGAPQPGPMSPFTTWVRGPPMLPDPLFSEWVLRALGWLGVLLPLLWPSARAAAHTAHWAWHGHAVAAAADRGGGWRGG